MVALLGSEEGCQGGERTASVVVTAEVFGLNLQVCHSHSPLFDLCVELTPIFTPTHPNIIRLRPTRLDEDPPITRIPRALSDMIRHPETH